MNTLDRKIGIILKQELREKGITQLEIAGSLNLSRSHLSNLLSGKRKMSLNMLYAICNILKVTPSRILLQADLKENSYPSNIERLEEVLKILKSLDENPTK